jgi:hypothetical protein
VYSIHKGKEGSFNTARALEKIFPEWDSTQSYRTSSLVHIIGVLDRVTDNHMETYLSAVLHPAQENMKNISLRLYGISKNDKKLFKNLQKEKSPISLYGVHSPLAIFTPDTLFAPLLIRKNLQTIYLHTKADTTELMYSTLKKLDEILKKD